MKDWSCPFLLQDFRMAFMAKAGDPSIMRTGVFERMHNAGVLGTDLKKETWKEEDKKILPHSLSPCLYYRAFLQWQSVINLCHLIALSSVT